MGLTLLGLGGTTGALVPPAETGMGDFDLGAGTGRGEMFRGAGTGLVGCTALPAGGLAGVSGLAFSTSSSKLAIM